MHNFAVVLALLSIGAVHAAPRFRVTIPGQTATFDGRLLLLLSTDGKAEPRFQISDGPGSQIVFGMDVEGWKPGAAQTVANEFGHPVRSLAGLKPG